LKAQLVSFDIENKLFTVSALKESLLYSYEEEMPDMEIRFKEREEKAIIDEIGVSRSGLIPSVIRGGLECGLEASMKGVEVSLPDGGKIYKVTYEINEDKVRTWLLTQLEVDKNQIVHGRIQFHQ
jgi:hypothetical protein